MAVDRISGNLFPASPRRMALHVLTHPLVDHILTLLRDERTDAAQFRILSRQVTVLLAVEATRDFPTCEVEIRTPMESTRGRRIDTPVVVVAIVRAGISMVDAIVDLIPSVSVGFIGMERDEETAEARSYYCKLPPLQAHRILVVDPMLATGGSAEHVIHEIYARQAEEVSFLNIVASPEGVERLLSKFPKLKIFTAALDRGLNDRKYILPGLGDFGDRLYGT